MTPGTIVFCEAWLLKEFLTKVAPQCPSPFIVVSSNGDPNFTADKLELIPSSVQALWTQNCEVRDPRVHPLPIGLENARLHTNGIVKDFDALRRRQPPHRNRILWGFSEVTNPVVRGPAREALQRCRVADHVTAPNSRRYRRRAAEYRFIASPPGNGVDCHRTWEALYLRCVPIVLRSVLTLRLEALGLPLWLVEDFGELETATEEHLAETYQALAPKFDHPALWLEFWERAVRNHGHI